MTTQKPHSTITQASAEDIPAVAALERSYYREEGYPAGFLYQSLTQWPQGFWVARQHQQVSGYALATPAQPANEYWLMAALVAPQARGQGLGERLCQHVISACRELDASQLWLSVAPDNHAAQRLYHKLGFVDVGLRSDFLGPGEHRRIMQLSINPKA